MRNMKRLLCLLCTAAMLCGVLCVPAGALSPIVYCFSPDENTMYVVERPYAKAPKTFEATIKVDKNLSGRGGVILGNYGANTACVSLEIHEKGVPRLYFVDADGTTHDLRFDSVDVRTGEEVDLAVVMDTENKKVHCYVDGELLQSISNTAEIEPAAYAHRMAVGGDFRTGNAQYFKGEISKVAVFSTVRDETDFNHFYELGSPLGVHFISYGDSLPETVRDYGADFGKDSYPLLLNRIWFTEKEPVTDYAYSFVLIGDTQIVTESYPDQLSCIYDWIVENKEEKKIEYVFGLGDITNSSTAAEWRVAKREISKLNGVVPYSMLRGNHDKADGYRLMFAEETYSSQFEGFHIDGQPENSWRTLTVGEVDYLLITLDFGASDAVLNWASKIISAHPHHRVIITTHGYMYRDGTLQNTSHHSIPNPTGADDGKANNGDQMWEKLISRHENIFMVLCGHYSTEEPLTVQMQGVYGNTVTTILTDPQTLDKTIGPTGMIVMLYFSKDGKTVSVEQYSTVREQYYKGIGQYDIEVPAYDPHSFTDFVSNGDATCTENGTKTAVCNGCDKALTIAALQSATGHSYVDGICTDCGAAEPVLQTETPETDLPLTASGAADSGIGSAILSGLVPALVFVCALAFGYIMAKRTKRK